MAAVKGHTKKVEDIDITEAKGKKAPSISIEDKPLSVTETTRKVLDEGSGETLPDDAYVEVDLAMFSGKDGKAIEGSETYTSSPIVLDLGNAQALPGLIKAIKGQKIGTGQCNVKHYNRRLMKLIERDRANPAQIISHRLPLDQAPDAYKHFDERDAGWTKVVLKPGT